MVRRTPDAATETCSSDATASFSSATHSSDRKPTIPSSWPMAALPATSSSSANEPTSIVSRGDRVWDHGPVAGALDRGIARRRLRRRDKSRDLSPPPDTSQTHGTNCLPEIQHVVLLMMENHSFDNYFRMLWHGGRLSKSTDPLP